MQKRSVAKCPLSFRIALRGKQNASMPGRAPEAKRRRDAGRRLCTRAFSGKPDWRRSMFLATPYSRNLPSSKLAGRSWRPFLRLGCPHSFSATLANYSSFLSHDDNSLPTRRMLFLDRPARRFRPRKFLMLSGSGSLESAVLASSCGPN